MPKPLKNNKFKKNIILAFFLKKKVFIFKSE